MARINSSHNASTFFVKSAHRFGFESRIAASPLLDCDTREVPYHFKTTTVSLFLFNPVMSALNLASMTKKIRNRDHRHG
jgi:hypothetical protein